MVNTHICPTSYAFALNNVVRRLIHPPVKLLQPFIERGQTVLDVGCGPGHFSIAMAKLVGPAGKVIAADLQPEMLSYTKKYAARHGLLNRMAFHTCQQNRIGLEERVDFALAFYMAHEHPNQHALLDELAEIVKPGGSFLLVEPKFHVSDDDFDETFALARQAGFFPKSTPKVHLSRAILFQLQT